MAKTVSLDGMLNPDAGQTAPIDGGQRKKISLHLSPADYKRLRLHAVESGMTHQDIAEKAMREFLDRV